MITDKFSTCTQEKIFGKLWFTEDFIRHFILYNRRNYETVQEGKRILCVEQQQDLTPW